jgi:hypothetical protein
MTWEGFLGSNSWLSNIISKFKARLGCKCTNGMTDDEFARKFLPQGFLNMMTGGSGGIDSGDFNEQCPVSYTIWSIFKDMKLSLPSTCTYSSYQSQVI